MPTPRTGQLVTIPILNDLIYAILYNSTLQQRRGLHEGYLKHLKTPRKAKNFVTTSSREEKEYLLSHFGFKFFYVITPFDVTKASELEETIAEFKKTKNIGRGIYIHGDEQFMYYLKLYAKSIHHPSYFLNYEISRAGYNIHNWPKHNLNRENMEVREIMERDNILMRTILSANIATQLYPGISGLTHSHIQILTYLYIKRHTFVSHDMLFAFFKGFGPYEKPQYIVNTMRELVNEHFAQKRTHNSKEYSITALGIKKIAEFRDYVLAYNSYY